MATIGTIRYRNGSNWVDILHPVGSFYFSTASTPPASLFGGTWVQITGAVIRGNNSLGYGGSDNHKLAVSEMPSHYHAYYGWPNKGSYEGTGIFAIQDSTYGSLGYNGRFGQIAYTDSRGGATAFTELPRYYNCYVWYRTA